VVCSSQIEGLNDQLSFPWRFNKEMSGFLFKLATFVGLATRSSLDWLRLLHARLTMETSNARRRSRSARLKFDGSPTPTSTPRAGFKRFQKGDPTSRVHGSRFRLSARPRHTPRHGLPAARPARHRRRAGARGHHVPAGAHRLPPAPPRVPRRCLPTRRRGAPALHRPPAKP
jgi:hypothetical protein